MGWSTDIKEWTKARKKEKILNKRPQKYWNLRLYAERNEEMNNNE